MDVLKLDPYGTYQRLANFITVPIFLSAQGRCKVLYVQTHMGCMRKYIWVPYGKYVSKPIRTVSGKVHISPIWEKSKQAHIENGRI